MERVRITREMRSRSSGRYPDKSGPFHDANTDSALKKIALQSGVATPSEVGLDLKERKDGEMSNVEIKEQQKGGPSGPEESIPGQPGEGRPKNVKDTQPRKPRVVRASAIAIVQSQAKIAQEKISKKPIL